MKRQWEELNTLSAKSQCSCVCTCGSKEAMHKEEQDQRLIQFLMGLNEVYTIVRGSILMMKSLPSLAQAFSLLIQEEKQREFIPNNQLNLESASLHVNATSTQHQNPFGAKNFKTHYTANNRGQPPMTIARNRVTQRRNATSYMGIPKFNRSNNSSQTQDHKFNRGKGAVANVHGVPVDLLHEKEYDLVPHDENPNVNLTREQYGQIMSLLHHIQTGNTRGSPSNANITNGAINFEDSGASNHMTFNKSALSNITTLPYPLLISLPNEYKVKVLEFGDVILSPEIILPKVLYVPSFKYNIISVHSLAMHLRCIVLFTDALCLLQTPSVKRPKVIGSSREGLYYICSKCLKGKSTFSNTDVVFKSVTFPTHIESESPLPNVQGAADIISPGVHQHPEFSPVNDTSTQPNNSLPYGSVHASSYEAASNNPPTSTQSETITIRKSNRTHKTPTYLKNYIYTLPNRTQLATSQCSPSLNALFSNHNHISHDALCSESQHLMTNVCHDSEPSSYGDASLNPAWQVAMTQEFEVLHANHTWDLVPLPAGK
ncbi:uncharacterized protein [Nicotiana sylvestris]|uniref:uncharacterized protein n=1 Tax=Nicotiana sylvestris TaxID=4096 RepID=UPI00388C9CBD